MLQLNLSHKYAVICERLAEIITNILLCIYDICTSRSEADNLIVGRNEQQFGWKIVLGKAYFVQHRRLAGELSAREQLDFSEIILELLQSRE